MTVSIIDKTFYEITRVFGFPGGGGGGGLYGGIGGANTGFSPFVRATNGTYGAGGGGGTVNFLSGGNYYYGGQLICFEVVL